jgi:TRAP transporter 4TM/12TM fusion protein
MVHNKFIKLIDNISFCMSVLLTCYIGISTIFLFQDVSVYYATFLAAILIITALEYVKISIEKRGMLRLILSFIIFIIAVFVSLYVACNATRLQIIQPFITDTDIIIGWLFVGIVIFLVTVHWGIIFGTIIGIAIAYFMWGNLLPIDILAHPPYDTKFVISYLGMNATGGFFNFVGLLVEQIYFLVFFASCLLGVGLLSLMTELGKAAGKRVRGGAAFPAIIGSTAIGAVMGQAVSNIALTGQLTIPMMIKYGFKKDTAGAIETVASTSGQLIPPVLGLAAFMIAATLNVQYIDIALRAIYPAFIYLAITTIAILTVSKVQKIGYLTEDIDWHLIIRLFPTFLVPFGVVLTLLMMYYSPSLAGLIGTPLIFIFAFLQGPKLRPKFNAFIGYMRQGLRLISLLCLLGIGIGAFAQIISVTQIASNLGIYFSMVLPNNLLLMLVLTMIICIFAGMGLPTPVAYLIVALTVVPFLQALGIPALIAHFFVFYFAIFSTISPPVALGCLAACKISGGSFMKTSLESMKIAGPTFITPFIFVYNPSLLEFPRISMNGLYILSMTLLVQFIFCIGLVGYFRRPLNFIERIAAVIFASLGVAYLITHLKILLILFLLLSFIGAAWVMLFNKNTAAVPA